MLRAYYSLDLRFKSYLREGTKFVIPGLTKIRSGPPKKVLHPSYPEDEKLCPVQILESYELRNKTTVFMVHRKVMSFLSVCKPHAPVKAPTIRHWLQSLMAQTEINISMFQHTLLEVQQPPRPKGGRGGGCLEQIF